MKKKIDNLDDFDPLVREGLLKLGFKCNGAVSYNYVKLPSNQVWGTYMIRFKIKIDQEPEFAKSGFAEVLSKLKKTDKDVMIHLIAVDEKSLYLVFTDATISESFGEVLWAG